MDCNNLFLNQKPLIMNTINNDIKLFNTEKRARAFFKTILSGHLLFGTRTKVWYVDLSKTAKFDWPALYSLIETK